jgi:hypothetical protein
MTHSNAYIKPAHPPNRTLERWLIEPQRPTREALGVLDHVLSIVEHVAPVVAGVALAIGAVVLLARLFVAHRPVSGASARLVTVGVPPEVEPAGGLLLWQALHDLLRPRWARLIAGQPHLSWEVAASEAGTVFRLWVPASVPSGLIERAIASAWPGASVSTQPVEDEPQLAGMVSVACELTLAGPDSFPLNAGMDPDPLPLLLGQLAGFDDGARALVQVIARPATVREQRRLRAAARRIRQGAPTNRVLRFIDWWRTNTPTPPRYDPTVSPDVRAVMEKSALPLYRCVIRVTVSAGSRREARGRIHAILGAFAPYNGPRVWLRRRRVFGAQSKVCSRQLGRRAFLLSTGELAALAHLPTTRAIPGVVMAGARNAPPPPGLPVEGKPLGVTTEGRQVNLAVADARQHLHILGPTGVGKSTLIANLVLADFDAGRGAVVIDPKGDLIEDLLERIPAGRESEVDLLDPLDEAPPGLNVLDSPDRELGVDQLVGIFHRVFERFWGPRTDDILRAALLTLTMYQPGATLADVPTLLTNRERQAELAAQIEDSVLAPFWEWYGELSDALRAQVTGPLLNKLRAFLLRGPVRAIVAQPTTTLDIPRAIDGGRLLLAKLSKGTLGEDTSRLLGSFVVARVWQAALARAGVEPERRQDSSLYVDEVHNYLNLPTPFEDIAAEARAYRLSLCLAHQHLAQLPRDLREALGANARTKVYFQVSRDDAGHLEREVAPDLSAHDLSHLPRYTAAVRLCLDGEPTQAFTLITWPLPTAFLGQADAVRAFARQRGTPKAQVEDRLARAGEEPLRRLERREPAAGAALGDAIGAAPRTATRTAAPPAGETPSNQATSAPLSAARQIERGENE